MFSGLNSECGTLFTFLTLIVNDGTLVALHVVLLEDFLAINEENFNSGDLS